MAERQRQKERELDKSWKGLKEAYRRPGSNGNSYLCWKKALLLGNNEAASVPVRESFFFAGKRNSVATMDRRASSPGELSFSTVL